MNRNKVQFDFVNCKPIENTDSEGDFIEPASPSRKESNSSKILPRTTVKDPQKSPSIR